MKLLSIPLILTLQSVQKLLVCIDSGLNPLLLQTDLPHLLPLPHRIHVRQSRESYTDADDPLMLERGILCAM